MHIVRYISTFPQRGRTGAGPSASRTRGRRGRFGRRRRRTVSSRTSGSRRTRQFPWNGPPRGSWRRVQEGTRWKPPPSRRRPARGSSPPLRLLFLLLLLFLRLRRPHQALREHPLQDDLHVHRVVLQERRRGHDREVVVVVQEGFRERLESEVALLDRRVPQLVTFRLLDDAVLRVYCYPS